MPDSQPLLTIAIPTYNRCRFLAELLTNLEPQLAGEDRVELIVSDNASPDATARTIESFQAQGMRIRHLTNSENVGPDENFFRCFRAALGKYVWIFGDDDLLMQGAVQQILSLLEQGEVSGDFDLVYLSSFGFTGEYHTPKDTVLKDKLGRFAEIVTDGLYFVEKVNSLIVTISANIVNKNRLAMTPHPPFEYLASTNLSQLGWLLPLIHSRCRVLYIWERLLAYRSLNSGGWNFWEVFGLRFRKIILEYFVEEPLLAKAIIGGVLRYYMTGNIIEMRKTPLGESHSKLFLQTMKPAFQREWRFWFFVYPLVALPMPLADFLYRFIYISNRLTRAVQAIFRHVFSHGQYVNPAVTPALPLQVLISPIGAGGKER